MAHDRIGQDRNGNQRLRRGDQPQHEQTGHHAGHRQQGKQRRRRPGVARAAQVQRQHERHAGDDDQQRADDVEAMRPLVARQAAQHECGDRQRRQSQRDVDPEDHRPVQVLGDEAAEHGAAAARRRIGDGEIAVVAAALLRRHQVAEHDHAHRRQSAAAQTMQRAAEDQHPHVGRQRADQRAGHVGEDRDAQREPPAADVGDLAVERDHRRRGEHVGGDQPGQALNVAEVAADDRQRGGQNGLVERAEERRQQDAEDDEQRFTMSKGRALTVLGVGIHWRSVVPEPLHRQRCSAQ